MNRILDLGLFGEVTVGELLATVAIAGGGALSAWLVVATFVAVCS